MLSVGEQSSDRARAGPALHDVFVAGKLWPSFCSEVTLPAEQAFPATG